MSATMRPIPNVASEPPITCPLPFVSQSRLDAAHGSIENAYGAARAVQRTGGTAQQVRQAALDDLGLPAHGRRGYTDLEVVAFYALLREKIPTQAEAAKDPELAVKLAVWQAVAG